MPQKIRKAVFPVGGLGTRFLPSTKALPKEMLPVANIPLIQRAFMEAKEAGIEQFIFINGRNKNVISNHFDIVYELNSVLSENAKARELSIINDWLPESGKTVFIRQQQTAGLGHAILCAKDAVGDEPFAVILADELLYSPNSEENFLKNMVRLYQERDANIIGLAEVAKSEVKKYGIADGSTDKTNSKVLNLVDLVEKPEVEKAPSNFSITGRYILKPEIFEFLKNQKAGVNSEIQLTDAMKKMMDSSDFLGLIFKGLRYDCGSPDGWLEANIALSLLNKETKEKTIEIIDRCKRLT